MASSRDVGTNDALPRVTVFSLFSLSRGGELDCPPDLLPQGAQLKCLSSRKSSGTAVAEFPSLAAPTSAPFIPQMTVHPSFLSTVLVSEFVPAESVTASLLLSTAAQLDGELWGGLAVPHVHLFVHFSRMC